MDVTHVSHVGTARVDKATQELLPISEQSVAKDLAIKHQRLIECWIGIATKEEIGSAFCADCYYLPTCKKLYFLFAGTRKIHPATLSKNIMRKFGIPSDFL